MITLLILYCLRYATAFLGLLVVFFIGAEILDVFFKRSLKIINSMYLFIEESLSKHH